MVERRKHHRVDVRLSTRFMLPDGAEYTAETLDASLSGISFKSRAVPYRGQRVIAYISDLGRVEGIATRVSKEGFAISISSSHYRRDKIAGALTWAKLEELGERSSERIIPVVKEGVVYAHSSIIPIEVVNVSRGGAAIRTSSFLPLGTMVSLGQYPAIVLRVEYGVYALAFERELDAEVANVDIRFT